MIIVLSLIRHRTRRDASVRVHASRRFRGSSRGSFVGFLVLAGLRVGGGDRADGSAGHAITGATVLTVLAMAALGLGVDVRVMRRVGASVTAAVSGSLVVLVVVSVTLIALLGWCKGYAGRRPVAGSGYVDARRNDIRLNTPEAQR